MRSRGSSISLQALQKMSRCFLLLSFLERFLCSSCFQETWRILWPLKLPTYLLLLIFGIVFEDLANSELIKHLTSQDLLSDTQNGFRFARSNDNVLTAITEAVDNNGEARTVALHVTNGFDRV